MFIRSPEAPSLFLCCLHERCVLQFLIRVFLLDGNDHLYFLVLNLISRLLLHMCLLKMLDCCRWRSYYVDPNEKRVRLMSRMDLCDGRITAHMIWQFVIQIHINFDVFVNSIIKYAYR